MSLRNQGFAYDQIADRLGFSGESGAREAVKRALARATDREVATLREVEASRITDLMARCYEELGREHFVVQFGRVVKTPRTGGPVRDTAAVIAIIREPRQLSSEMSKLRGLHAPMRTIVEEVTRTMVEAEIRRINAMADKVEDDLRANGIPSPEEPEP